MLGQSPVRPHKHCPRWWSLAAAGGLLSLAVLVSGIGQRAEAAQAAPQNANAKAANAAPGNEPAQEPKAKAPQQTPQAGAPHIPQAGASHATQFQPTQQFHPVMPGYSPEHSAFTMMQEERRLGIRLSRPNEILTEQLNLPKNEGLIVDFVQPNSAGAKAGLKVHDILLELDGKPVSNDPQALLKTVEGIKPDQAVDLEVLRKGKHETLKGVKFPEARVATPHPGFRFPGYTGAVPGQPQFPHPATPTTPFYGTMPGMGLMAGREVITTNFRAGDHFTTRYQEGSLIITLTGHVTEGKEKVSQIHIQDGRESKNYESVASVPREYRDKVQSLVEGSEPTNSRLEIKTPSEGKAPGAKPPQKESPKGAQPNSPK